MSEFPFFLEVLRRHLPLEIAVARFEAENLCLAATDWNFNTTSPWRVVDSGSILVGAEYKNAADLIRELVGSRIVEARVQSTTTSVDPLFQLHNGRTIEIFTCYSVDAWTLKLPGEPMIVAP